MSRIEDAVPYLPKTACRSHERESFPIFDCVLSSLGGILAHLGYSEDLAFLLCRNLSFYWISDGSAFSKAGCDLIPIHDDLGEIDNIQLCDLRFSDEREFLGSVTSKISRKMPILVHVDPYYIPGYSSYHREHLTHVTLATGIDTSSRTIDLRDLFDERTISIDDFLRAANACLFAQMFVERPQSRKVYDRDLLFHLLDRNNTMGRVANSSQVALPASVSDSLKTHGKMTLGPSGIRRFASEVEECFGNGSADNNRAAIESMFESLYPLVVQRTWYAEFLIETGMRLGLSESFDGLGHHALRMAQHWTVLRNMFLKASRKRPDEMLARIRQRLMSAAEEEEELLERTVRAVALS